MGRTQKHPEDQRLIRYSLRLPRDLYDDLKGSSEAGGWSLHAEILLRLRQQGRGRQRAARAATVPAAPAPEQEGGHE